MPYRQSIHTSILHCLTSEEPLTITFSIVQLSTHTSTELVPCILSIGHITAWRHEYPLFCLCTFLGIFGLQGPPVWPICFQRQLSKLLDKNWMGYLAFLFTTLCLHFFIPMCQYACADVDAAAVPQILHITAAFDKCQYPLVIRDRNVTSASGLKWFGRVWRWQGFACEVEQFGLTGSPPNGAKKISSWFWIVSDERCTFPDYQNKHAPPNLNMQSIFEQLYSVEEIHNSSRIRAPRPTCVHASTLWTLICLTKNFPAFKR